MTAPVPWLVHNCQQDVAQTSTAVQLHNRLPSSVEGNPGHSLLLAVLNPVSTTVQLARQRMTPTPGVLNSH